MKDIKKTEKNITMCKINYGKKMCEQRVLHEKFRCFVNKMQSFQIGREII